MGMSVTGDSTDVTTYFVLRSSTDGTELTGATITNIDLQYVRSGAAPAAKVDATALAATDSAHADNKAIEIDATDAPGLYRVDWPDAAFAAGVREAVKTAGTISHAIDLAQDFFTRDPEPPPGWQLVAIRRVAPNRWVDEAPPVDDDEDDSDDGLPPVAWSGT